MYEYLKNRRIELGKTIEEIAEQTKIKKSYLIAIEEGRFEELPIEVYTRAYIKTYAQTVGVDPQPILKEYEEYLQRKKQKEQPVPLQIQITAPKEDAQKSIKTKISLKNLPKWAVKAAITVVVILLIVVITKILHKEETIPPSPSLNTAVTVQTTEIPKTETIQASESKNQPALEQQTIKIEATDKVWMRITIDDKEKKEFLLEPGQTVSLKANKSFKLHIGNAGGVRITFNDKELEKLGNTGQVVFLTLPQDKN